ncbi:MAG: hypothetical protein CVU16_11380 [Betaproteobacteria bacterium HGW-Betaproteobacteria-10]|nr:MAG: hypothetical protein CVU16_11380 [Betaproteobacteria bacterium HGW-Betaproteobacteria-10]
MVVFDSESWESHLLPPSATVIADIIAELSDGGPVSSMRLKQVLRDEYELDPDSSAIGDFLGMLNEIGMLSE